MNENNIIRCPVCGHSYDRRRSDGCPNCSRMVVSPGAQSDDNDVTVIQKAAFNSVSSLDSTVGMNVSLKDDPNDVTIGVSLSKSGNKRGEITGWLVCVSGPDFGKDFRLRYNNNFVGRAMNMDVCIASDEAVHKDKHMTVVYEPVENKFYCAPIGGAISYLNGETLSKSAPLHDFDRLRVGNTELVFRSLCGEDFKWQEKE